MFFVIEKKSEETIFNFSRNSATIINNENAKFVKWFWQWKLKFAIRKWNIIDSESKGNYLPDDRIKFLTSSLESSLAGMQDKNKWNFFWWNRTY